MVSVKIIHGANDDFLNVAGMTVATIKENLRDAFNIPAEAIAFVNGALVKLSYRLLPNDTLEFVKRRGVKSILDSDEQTQLEPLESLPVYKTLKAARSDGWHVRKEDEVGGEEITLKGHTLVRKTQLLRYVYKTTLRKTYGMTPSMIEELGKPDKVRTNPHYQSGPEASLYLIERVEAWVESNQAWLQKAQESRPKRSAAMKGVHAKKRAERWLEALKWIEQLSIMVNRPLPTTLLADARKHFTIPDQVDLLKNKALFAHVRHRETNYESLLQELYQQEFSNELYPLLRRRIDPLVQEAVVEWHRRRTAQEKSPYQHAISEWFAFLEDQAAARHAIRLSLIDKYDLHSSQPHFPDEAP